MKASSSKPVILLTGFLGSGKTTLLRRWLDEAPASGRRIGILMNEFGRESVDTTLLAQPGLAIREVAGGCLCCTDDNEIGRVVTEMARREDVDYLVVETSGLADPDNVIDILTDMDLLPLVHLQAVVTVVDGLWYARPTEDGDERILARKQVQFAQVVAISKCDLISPAERDEVEQLLRVIQPMARFVRLPFGMPDPGEILDQTPANHQIDWPKSDRDPENHLHVRYQSISFRFPIPVDRSRFEAFLSSLPPREVVRIKGFVRFQQTPDTVHIFQSVFGHHVIDAYKAKPDPASVAVLIGPSLNAAALQEKLRALAFGTSGKSWVVAATPLKQGSNS